MYEAHVQDAGAHTDAMPHLVTSREHASYPFMANALHFISCDIYTMLICKLSKLIGCLSHFSVG